MKENEHVWGYVFNYNFIGDNQYHQASSGISGSVVYSSREKAHDAMSKHKAGMAKTKKYNVAMDGLVYKMEIL